MKKEYCQLESHCLHVELVANNTLSTSVIVWRVLLGTKESPSELINTIKKDWKSGELFSQTINSDRGYRISHVRGSSWFLTEKTEQLNRYMKNEKNEDLIFLTKLDAINYLSKNGGWYLDAQVLDKNGHTYILARDVENS